MSGRFCLNDALCVCLRFRAPVTRGARARARGVDVVERIRAMEWGLERREDGESQLDCVQLTRRQVDCVTVKLTAPGQ